MTDIKWNEIKKEADAFKAWTGVSKLIAEQLFHSNMFVIKDLASASYYDLLTCFVKEQKTFSTRKRYELIGHVSDLLKTTGEAPGTNMSQFLKLCSHIPTADFPQNYSHTWTKGKEFVRVDLNGMTKHVINWALMTTPLVLDPALPIVKKHNTFYIISEVVYANVLEIHLELDGLQDRYRLEQRTPIAISYEKFPIDGQGRLGSALNTRVDVNAEFNAQ